MSNYTLAFHMFSLIYIYIYIYLYIYVYKHIVQYTVYRYHYTCTNIE